jgi:hypothetical protein
MKMIDLSYATAKEALFALKSSALSAFAKPPAHQNRKARRAGQMLPMPGPSLSDAAEFGSVRTANPPAMNTHSLWSSLPLIGGEALDLEPTDRFLSPDFLRRYQPETTTLVYAAGCNGIRAMVEPLKLLVFKLGTHSAGDLSIRMKQLNQARYAGRRQTSRESEPGFASWLIWPVEPRYAETSPGSPVRSRNDALEIRLPAGLTNARFDQQLNRALCSASLETFARSRTGEAYCAARGVDPASLMRGTGVGDDQPESARELILFRPYQDLRRLVRVCEDLIYQHVMEAPVTH